MKSRTQTATVRGLSDGPVTSGLLVMAILCILGVLSYAPAQQKAPPPVHKSFATPEAGAEALIAAAEAYDVPTLLAILGPNSKDLVSTEDSVADKTRAATFASLARQKHSVSVDAKNPNRAELLVGDDDWPLPVPLVKRNGQWLFDAKAGREEVLFRRIGQNELDAIQFCRGFVEAELDYALDKHDGSTVNQYAQRVISLPGKQDGLAWRNPDGSWGGPSARTPPRPWTRATQPLRIRIMATTSRS